MVSPSRIHDVKDMILALAIGAPAIEIALRLESHLALPGGTVTVIRVREEQTKVLP